MRFTAGLCVALVTLSGCSATSDGEEATFEPRGEQVLAPGNTAVSESQIQLEEAPNEAQIADVMTKLESVRADVRRNVLAARSYTGDDALRLEAIFAGNALEFQRGVWQDAAVYGAPELNDNPRDGYYPVTEVVNSTSDCVWFRSRPSDDYKTPPPQIAIDIVLVRQSHDETINPTPWMITEFTPVGWLDAAEVC